MQANTSKPKKNRFIGTKILIGSLSLAGTVGLWNSFANKPPEIVKAASDQGSENVNNQNSVVIEFPPLPTLVPVQVATLVQTDTQATNNQSQVGIRKVVQPTPEIVVQSSKPVFERITVNRAGSGGSGGSSGGSSSGSSR
jgi:uncharacterized membrane protein YgcG